VRALIEKKFTFYRNLWRAIWCLKTTEKTDITSYVLNLFTIVLDSVMVIARRKKHHGIACAMGVRVEV